MQFVTRIVKEAPRPPCSLCEAGVTGMAPDYLMHTNEDPQTK